MFFYIYIYIHKAIDFVSHFAFFLILRNIKILFFRVHLFSFFTFGLYEFNKNNSSSVS